MIGLVDRVDGACCAERLRLIHRTDIGSEIAVVLSETERIGGDGIGRQWTVGFLSGLARLFETAAIVVALAVGGRAKARIGAARGAGPIIGARNGPIGIIAVRK